MRQREKPNKSAYTCLRHLLIDGTLKYNYLYRICTICKLMPSYSLEDVVTALELVSLAKCMPHEDFPCEGYVCFMSELPRVTSIIVQQMNAALKPSKVGKRFPNRIKLNVFSRASPLLRIVLSHRPYKGGVIDTLRKKGYSSRNAWDYSRPA